MRKVNLDEIKGEFLGSGSEKFCFVNKKDKSRCIKISLKNKSDQIRREIKYFEFLNKRNTTATFLPKFYGSFEDGNFIGYEQECFVGKINGGLYDNVWMLSEYIEDPNNNIKDLDHELNRLKSEMIEKNIICCDLDGNNIIRVKNKNASKLVIIDGFGPAELIPLCKFLRFFGKQKIERQWSKLIRRLKRNFKIRNNGN